MKTKSNSENGIVVFEIIGQLDTNTSSEVESKLDEIVELNTEKLVIDLKETTFVSSSGLRVFLSISKKMKAKSHVLKFCCANKIIQEIFAMTGFNAILNVKLTKGEALQDLN